MKRLKSGIIAIIISFCFVALFNTMAAGQSDKYDIIQATKDEATVGEVNTLNYENKASTNFYLVIDDNFNKAIPKINKKVNTGENWLEICLWVLLLASSAGVFAMTKKRGHNV